MANSNIDTEPKTYDINEIRNKTRIDIFLPLNTYSDDRIDQFEYVNVNGRRTQIKCGETVSVPWPVFEAIANSGRYNIKQILV